MIVSLRTFRALVASAALLWVDDLDDLRRGTTGEGG